MNHRVLSIISLIICLMLSFQSCQKEPQAERQLDEINEEDNEDGLKAGIYAYLARILADNNTFISKMQFSLDQTLRRTMISSLPQLNGLENMTIQNYV